MALIERIFELLNLVHHGNVPNYRVPLTCNQIATLMNQMYFPNIYKGRQIYNAVNYYFANHQADSPDNYIIYSEYKRGKMMLYPNL